MEYYYLNRDSIERILREQELKRWWVAEFSGVHVTTFRRWMSGRIRKVSANHVKRLAEVLETRKCVISYPVCDHKNGGSA